MSSLPDWPRAHGEPLFDARIRTTNEDFRVTEDLGVEFSGEGEHDVLYIEKDGANTEWVARQLAKHAGIAAKDVGYSGLKDRHAFTRQWYSVPAWNKPDWSQLDIEGVTLLEQNKHSRKLRRGMHRANHFEIVLRGDEMSRHEAAVSDRLDTIREHGVPNYFGEQRFGRDGGNVGLANDWAAGARLPRHKRGLAISTIRSYLFNEILAERIADGTWNTILDGDKANLDGTGSVFDVELADDEIGRRCTEMDIHPTGPLAGDGSDGHLVFDRWPDWMTALGKARVEPATRLTTTTSTRSEHNARRRCAYSSFHTRSWCLCDERDPRNSEYLKVVYKQLFTIENLINTVYNYSFLSS